MRYLLRLRLPILLLCPSLLFAGSGSQKKAAPNADTKKPQTQLFRIYNPDTLAKPAGGYSQVAEVNGGKIVFISGQIPVDRNGKLVGKDDFQVQLAQVFENLKAAVRAAGGDTSSIIKLNFYCVDKVDQSQMPKLREVRDKYVNTANPPTSSFIFVSRLVNPDWLIEVDAVAVVKK